MNDMPKETTNKRVDISYVEQRYSFARKEQWVSKFFIAFILSFLIVGLLGLFGNGPISNQTISGGMYNIEYPQFLRMDTPSELYINLQNPPDTTVISFANSYIKDVQIKQITPTPESVEIADNHLQFSFVTSSEGTIAFSLQPERSGSKELEIGIQGDVTSIKQFVYF